MKLSQAVLCILLLFLKKFPNPPGMYLYGGFGKSSAFNFDDKSTNPEIL